MNKTYRARHIARCVCLSCEKVEKKNSHHPVKVEGLNQILVYITCLQVGLQSEDGHGKQYMDFHSISPAPTS